MYGCAAALLLALFSSTVAVSTSTTESSDRSPRTALETPLSCNGSTTKFLNCTEDEPVIRAKCHPMLAARERFETSSKCCSFGIYNSSLHKYPCFPGSPTSKGGLQTCHQYELLSCESFNLSLLCHVNTTGKDQITWRRVSDGLIMTGRSLKLRNVQRDDSGTYACEVTDKSGRLKKSAEVVISVQFPPVILVPNQSQFSMSDRLECTTEANPPASITWYKSDTLLPASWYRSETVNCTTWSEVQLDSDVVLSSSLYENYTCLASNIHGRSLAILQYAGPIPVEDVSTKRRFNVTGFIVGMLPPLFISFYIILKLGYRSRYAEERGEDDGIREEPFFISY